MRFNEIVTWFKVRRRAVLLVVAALFLVVLVALFTTFSTSQDDLKIVFVLNLFAELFGALTVAIVAGVIYEKLFTKTIVEQITIRQEKSMSKVGRLLYQIDDTTSEISRSKARMIELLDEGISITDSGKTELHENS